jgi:hypothetical protein
MLGLPIEDGDRAVVREQQLITGKLEGRYFFVRRRGLISDQAVSVYAVRQAHYRKLSVFRDRVNQLAVVFERGSRARIEPELGCRLAEPPLAKELIHIPIE